MKFILILACSAFLNCTQKKVYYIFPSLKEQKVIIYFEMPKKYSILPRDSKDDFIADFTKTNILYTSTDFKDIKNCRPIFCFSDSAKNNCYFDEFRLNDIGYRVIVNSSFTSDTLNKKDYNSSAIEIIIKRK